MEGDATRRLNEQAEHYESIIRGLREKIDAGGPTQRSTVIAQPLKSKDMFGVQLLDNGCSSAQDAPETDSRSLNLVRVLDFLERDVLDKSDGLDVQDALKQQRLTGMWGSIFGESADDDIPAKGSKTEKTVKCLVALLGYSFELLHAMQADAVQILSANANRELAHWDEMSKEFSLEAEKDRSREHEVDALTLADPLRASSKFNEIGNHLAPLPRLEAITRIEGKYRSNNDSMRGSGGEEAAVRIARDKSAIDKIFGLPVGSVDAVEVNTPKSLLDFRSPVEFVEACGTLHAAIQRNIGSISIFMDRKDSHYKALKRELMTQMLEKRKREEEVLNWSYILKHLLASSAKLKSQLRDERMLDARAGSHTASHMTSFSGGGLVGDQVAVGAEKAAEDAKAALFRVMQRTQIEMAGSSVRDYPQSTRLGARLAHTNSVLNHNKYVMAGEEYDQIGPPPDSPPESDVELGNSPGIGGRAGSGLKSPGRRLGEYSTTKSWAGSSLGNSSVADRDELLDDADNDYAYFDEASDWSITNSSIPTSSSMGLSRDPYKQAAQRNRSGRAVGTFRGKDVGHELPVPPRSGRSRSRERTPRSLGRRPLSADSDSQSNVSSQFVQKVVANLGVDKDQERAAMEVISRVTNITPAQLAKLDETTRQQVLDMRRQLGVDASLPGAERISGLPHNSGSDVAPPSSRGNHHPPLVHASDDDDDDFSQL